MIVLLQFRLTIIMDSGYKNRHDISQIIKSGEIASGNIDNALLLANITPSNQAWTSFLSKLLLWLGVIALSSSIMFFIAYNWDDLGRFAKFGLVEAFIIASVLFYLWSNKNSAPINALDSPQKSSLIGKATLLVASLSLGVLLAFYGQTYQTGADPWQLFFTWALLIIPWTMVAQFPALWIILLVLLNITVSLYIESFGGFLGGLVSSEKSFLWVTAGINSIALIIWELLKGRLNWLNESWATRVIAFAAGLPLTLLVIEAIFDRHQSFSLAYPVWAIAMVAIYVVYRKFKPDLFMLAMACLSGIGVILSFAGHTLFKTLDLEIGAFLFLAIFVIALGGSAAVWLKNIYKEQQA